MANFGLVKSFDIDDGQLDDFERHVCFTMGYELALIDEALKRPEAISRLVSSRNSQRIKKACQDAGRRWSLVWMQGDSSEEWMQLEVEGR